jgi:hypothetical protein
VFWAIPLATTRSWLTQPTLSGLRVLLLVFGAYTPFVAAFALSFRDGTAGRCASARFPGAFRAVSADGGVSNAGAYGGCDAVQRVGWREAAVVIRRRWSCIGRRVTQTKENQFKRGVLLWNQG